jgi:preprotein translocase subunit SecA
VADWAKEEGIAEAEIRERINEAVARKMAAKNANIGPQQMRALEKQFLLWVLDHQWKDHLLSLDHLRQGIHLRAYGQRDPLNEYKREAFELFEAMLSQVRDEVTTILARIEPPSEEQIVAALHRQATNVKEGRQDPAAAPAAAAAEEETAGQDVRVTRRAQPVVSRQAAAELDSNDPSTWGKVPRNAPCPCQSGRKYKHCHGRLG